MPEITEQINPDKCDWKRFEYSCRKDGIDESCMLVIGLNGQNKNGGLEIPSTTDTHGCGRFWKRHVWEAFCKRTRKAVLEVGNCPHREKIIGLIGELTSEKEKKDELF